MLPAPRMLSQRELGMVTQGVWMMPLFIPGAARGRAMLGHCPGVVPTPAPNPVEPHPPTSCFPSPSVPALDHLFFMSAGGRCLGKAELEEAALGHSGQGRNSTGTALFLPIPKCSGTANMDQELSVHLKPPLSTS